MQIATLLVGLGVLIIALRQGVTGKTRQERRLALRQVPRGHGRGGRVR
jgi:hypothetical protein